MVVCTQHNGKKESQGVEGTEFSEVCNKYQVDFPGLNKKNFSGRFLLS